MNQCTICKHRSLTLQFELGPFETDKKLAFVESVCGVLNESRFGPGWRKTGPVADGGGQWTDGGWQLVCRPPVAGNNLTFNWGCQNRLRKCAPIASESFVQNYNFAGEDYFPQRRTGAPSSCDAWINDAPSCDARVNDALRCDALSCRGIKPATRVPFAVNTRTRVAVGWLQVLSFFTFLSRNKTSDAVPFALNARKQVAPSVGFSF